jgi:hypothetical protein
MPYRPLTILALAAAVVAGGACASKGPAGTGGSGSGANVFGDPVLVGIVDFRDVRTRITANGVFEVEGTFVKRTADDARFRWRIEWFDDRGFRLEDPTQSWETVELKGIASQHVKVTAVSTHVATWRVHVELNQ